MESFPSTFRNTHNQTKVPANVLVIGDVILDRYWFGDTSRISPEAPVPVVRIGERQDRPGGAGNVATNIRGLGASAILVGLTGTDDAADCLTELLQAQGVTCAFTRSEGFQTVTKLRVLSRQQQLIRLDFEQCQQAQGVEGLYRHFQQHLADVDVVVVSDYAKGSLNDPGAIIMDARQADKQVIVDPKGNDFSRYQGASVITPNLKEFQTVVGSCAGDGDIEQKGRALCADLGFGAVLVTRGEQGMSLISRDGAPTHLPTRAAEVFDVTGAGDTVVATLAVALASGHNLIHATSLANTAAGLVVAKLGAASVSEAELNAAIHQRHAADNGILDEEALMQEVGLAKARGERIVMTNGCFDLLHTGHIRYLQEARRRGHRLIVAVNDDDSVRRLKDASRPINPLEQRMEVLSALSVVDWVVPFSEDTPARLIERVLPDVLVKGGDYRPEDIAGGAVVMTHGGEVVIAEFQTGFSTTGMIKSMAEKGGAH